MAWLIVLAVLILLAILPLGVCVQYEQEGMRIRVIAGPLRFAVYPRKHQKSKKVKNEKSAEEKKTVAKTGLEKPAEKKGGSVTDFLPLVKTAFAFLGDLRRKLRADVLEMKLIMAGGDPCNLAINYGKAWIALGNLMPHLERIFVIKKRDMQVECDFSGTQTTVYVHADLTITFGRILLLAVRYGVRVLRDVFNIRNKRKGGALQ